MSVEVVMPQMGESITEGTVSKWLKKVGDKIEKDEAILEISTDKVDAEVPSPGAGTLLEIRHNEGDTVEVGTVLAVIGAESNEPAAAGSQQSAVSGQPATATVTAAAPAPAIAAEPEPTGAVPAASDFLHAPSPVLAATSNTAARASVRPKARRAALDRTEAEGFDVDDEDWFMAILGFLRLNDGAKG